MLYSILAISYSILAIFYMLVNSKALAMARIVLTLIHVLCIQKVLFCKDGLVSAHKAAKWAVSKAKTACSCIDQRPTLSMHPYMKNYMRHQLHCRKQVLRVQGSLISVAHGLLTRNVRRPTLIHQYIRTSSLQRPLLYGPVVPYNSGPNTVSYNYWRFLYCCKGGCDHMGWSLMQSTDSEVDNRGGLMIGCG